MEYKNIIDYLLNESDKKNIKLAIDNYYKVNYEIFFMQETVDSLLEQNKYFIFEYIFKNGYIYHLPEFEKNNIDIKTLLATSIDSSTFITNKKYTDSILKKIKNNKKSNSIIRLMNKIYKETKYSYMDEVCNIEKFKSESNLYKINVISTIIHTSLYSSRCIREIVEIINDDYLFKFISDNLKLSKKDIKDLFFSYLLIKNKLDYFNTTFLIEYSNILEVNKLIKQRFKNKDLMDQATESDFYFYISFYTNKCNNDDLLEEDFLDLIKESIHNYVFLEKLVKMLKRKHIDILFLDKIKKICYEHRWTEKSILSREFIFSDRFSLYSDDQKEYNFEWIEFLKNVYLNNEELFNQNMDRINKDLRPILLIDNF